MQYIKGGRTRHHSTVLIARGATPPEITGTLSQTLATVSLNAVGAIEEFETYGITIICTPPRQQPKTQTIYSRAPLPTIEVVLRPPKPVIVSEAAVHRGRWRTRPTAAPAPLSEITGTLSETLGAISLSATGTVETVVTGTLSQTLGDATLEATGTLDEATGFDYVIAHAADPNQVVPYLVEILSPTPFRWTTFGRPIYALTYVWTNYAVDVAGLSLPTYDQIECTVTIGDANDTVAAADLIRAKGLTGIVVNVWECWLNPVTFAVKATVKKFKGRILSVDLDESIARLNCGAYSAFGGKKTPRWIVASNCPYRFKDSRCGYVGAATSCDHTWTDCGTKSNQPRFGGMRNLPTANTKIVWKNGVWTVPGIVPTGTGGGGTFPIRRR